jgi:hypothetical protein
VALLDSEVEKRLASLPSLDEVERMARQQLADAQRVGHIEGMRQAQEVLASIQRLRQSGAIKPDQPIGQVLATASTAKQYADALRLAGQGGNSLFGFDPISYMHEFFQRSPWPAGTKTLKERELEASITSQALRDALAEAEVTGTYKGSPTLAARQITAAITGYDPVTGRPTWEREYGMGQLGMDAQRLALQRELGHLPYQYATVDALLQASQPGGSGTKYTKDDYEADLYGLREYYASAKDYRASLERNATEIIRRIGKSAYNRLLEEAREAERQEMSGQLKWVRRYQVQGDPIREYFKMIGG